MDNNVSLNFTVRGNNLQEFSLTVNKNGAVVQIKNLNPEEVYDEFNLNEYELHQLYKFLNRLQQHG